MCIHMNSACYINILEYMNIWLNLFEYLNEALCTQRREKQNICHGVFWMENSIKFTATTIFRTRKIFK